MSHSELLPAQER